VTFSIAIPSFDSPNTQLHLGQLLDSICKQVSSQTFNIYIGFHTVDKQSYKSFAKFLETYDLNIVHFPNNRNVGNWITNINYVLDRIPDQDFVKIMFQDDILLRKDTLKCIRDSALMNRWTAFGFTHFSEKSVKFIENEQIDKCFIDAKFYRPVIPRYDLRMPSELINFIGAPSAILLPPRNKLRFDKTFVFTGDVEFYYRLFLTYGYPSINPDIHVGIRQHSESMTSRLQRGTSGRMPDGRRIQNIKDVHAREVIIFKRKHGFNLSPHETRRHSLKMFIANLRIHMLKKFF
jgi:hypothetical protein